VCLLCCESVCAGFMSVWVFFVVDYVWACLWFLFVLILCCVCCMCCWYFGGVIDMCGVFGCVQCWSLCVFVCVCLLSVSFVFGLIVVVVLR